MAYDRVPMFIDGGPRHPGAVVRNQTWKATNGETGVGSPTGLLVRPTSTPSTSIRVGAGTFVVENNYPSATPEQSYSGRNLSDTLVPVTSTTGAGARNDLVVWRIDDPEYTGAVVDFNTAEFQRPEIITNVPASAVADRAAAQAWLRANKAYPAVALAGLILPASTATVTAGMVRDLRDMANPRSKRIVNAFAISLPTEYQVQNATGEAGQEWPTAGGWYVDVPRWATRVIGIATWASVRAEAGTRNGELYWRLGSNASSLPKPTSQVGKYDTTNVPDMSRFTAVVADNLAIPPEIRGQRVYAHMRARLREGNPGVQLDWASNVVLDLEFLEAPTFDSVA